jgi:alkylation response protein AidB-like acyl-CoA dehydrogenase
MRLAPSDEQRRFAEVLDTLLTRADPAAVAAAWADGDTGPGRRLWESLAGAGVTGLLVPERFGGLGAGADDLVVACEVLGRHAVPGPVAESVAAAPVLLSTGRWLPELADGRIVASVVAPPWLPYAADGDSADLILVVQNDTVRTGKPWRVHRSIDPARRLASVRPDEVVETGGPIMRALDLGALACAAQLLGAGHTLLAMAVEHARTRTQFGRPIGSFQAVRHQLADVAVELAFARPLLHAAAVALSRPVAGLTDAGRDVSAAKVACGEAALRAARTALQVHGAIGYTREHELGRYLLRVRALHLSWGTPGYHRQRILVGFMDDSRDPDAPVVRPQGGDPPPRPGGRVSVPAGECVAVWPRDGVGAVGPAVTRTAEEGFDLDV